MEPLVVPGTLDALDPVADFVIAAATEAGLDKKATYNLRLAVDEVVTNIVTHGYMEHDCTGDLKLYAQLDAETLAITVEDTAPPYNPLERQMPDDLDVPLEEREMGGLGVYLALKIVDDFSYQFNAGKNYNRFIMRRPPT